MRSSRVGRGVRVVLLVAVALWAAACRGDTPLPAPATAQPPTSSPVAATLTVPRGGPPSATSEGEPAAVVASATPSATPGPLVLGGLASPDTVPWMQPSAADPLAFRLSQTLHRSLLDPRQGTPALAADWEVVEGRVRFTLPAGAAWSDGRPITAAAVVALLERAAAQGQLPAMVAARAEGMRVLSVELADPLCPALMQVGTWPLAPVPTWPPTRTSGAGVVAAQGTSTWQIGGATDGFTYQLFEDELALRAAWQRGAIGGVVGASKLTMGPLSGSPQPSREPGPLLATLLFRLEDPLLEARPLREALTLATDRGALFEAAYGFQAPALLTALLPPGHWAAPEGPLPFDVELAAARLDQAGWRDRDQDGVRENAAGDALRLLLSLPLSLDHRWEKLAQALVEQWASLGIELTPLYLEAYSLQERLHNPLWQVALVAYSVEAEPDQRALWTAPAADDWVGEDLNVTGYGDPQVAALLEEAATVAGCSLAARGALYHEAWNLIMADPPLLPLFPLPRDEMYQTTDSP